MTHKTVDIMIDGNSVPVDCNIVAIVQWLNEYQSVKTLYSCEGDADSPNSSYVLFLCKDPLDLRKIIQRLEVYIAAACTFRYGTITIDLYPSAENSTHGDWNEFRYDLKFPNTEMREKFTQYLETNVFNIDVLKIAMQTLKQVDEL